MSKKIALQILDHPNKDEILSKLVINTSCADIHEWLDAKYGALGKKDLVISASGLSKFKDEYLEYTVRIRDDLTKMQTKLRDPDTEVNLALADNKEYEKKLVKHLDKEIDIKKAMIDVFEIANERLAQINATVQQNPSSFKGDRYIIDYFDKIGSFLERYHKLVLAAPETTVQHNITLNVVDKHAIAIQNAIKKILTMFDAETALKFVDILTTELSGLKETKEGFLPLEDRYIEAQLLEEKITTHDDE